MRVFLWSSDNICGTHLAQILLYPKFLLRISWRRDREIWGNISCSWSRVKHLSYRICSSACFFRSSVMRDGCPDRSSSLTFVLTALNIQRHFLTLQSFVTPSPYTAISCRWMSVARTICAFKKQITDCTSQSAGLSSFVIILNTYKNCSNDVVGAKLTGNKDKGPQRSSDLESARKVDLRERCAQMVCILWTTLILCCRWWTLSVIVPLKFVLETCHWKVEFCIYQCVFLVRVHETVLVHANACVVVFRVVVLL
jgi:hypothetical protein